MIPIRARILASRHADLLGRPLSSRRVSAGLFLPTVLWGGFLLLAGALWWESRGLDALDIVLIVLGALLFAACHLAAIDARLVVCERGLILGRMVPVPFSPTYLIAGEEIDPRTVCVVSSGQKAAAQMGLGPMFFQFFVVAGSPGVPAVMFRGPWGADVELNRTPDRRRPNAKSLFLFSHRRAAGIADEILRLVGRCGGIPSGFEPVNGLRPIPVTGRREDAVRQIPGAWPDDSQRPPGR